MCNTGSETDLLKRRTERNVYDDPQLGRQRLLADFLQVNLTQPLKNMSKSVTTEPLKGKYEKICFCIHF